MIGVAISTYNRNELTDITLAKVKEFLPKDAMLIVVDDGSTIPYPKADFTFPKNVGTPVVKNKSLEILYNAGCNHIFLFDNDCYPKRKGWEQIYIESSQPHLNYIFRRKYIAYTKDGLVFCKHSNGCLMYFERRVLDRIGGFDTAFKYCGSWHSSYSVRAFNAGLTLSPYIDAVGSKHFIHSMDESDRIKTTRADKHKHGKSNLLIFEQSMGSDKFHPFTI